jgi:hypothetical protein
VSVGWSGQWSIWADDIVPEKLHLIYPQSLAGRLELSDDLRANVEVIDPRAAAIQRQIDIEEVRTLVLLTLRLEALCSTTSVPPIPMPTSPTLESSAQVNGHGEVSSPRRQIARQASIPFDARAKAGSTLPPTYLGPNVSDASTDEELARVIESLTTRIENALSTLVSLVVLWKDGTRVGEGSELMRMFSISRIWEALQVLWRHSSRLRGSIRG